MIIEYADVRLAVAGAHLTGQPLNHQLTERDARREKTTTLAPQYRLFALATEPPKPGVVRVAEGGSAIEVEVWWLSAASFGDFVAHLPHPMAIGQVELADGSLVRGFVVEQIAVEGALDITSFGGWRGYLASRG